jgi:hypothetical protein
MASLVLLELKTSRLAQLHRQLISTSLTPQRLGRLVAPRWHGLRSSGVPKIAPTNIVSQSALRNNLIIEKCGGGTAMLLNTTILSAPDCPNLRADDKCEFPQVPTSTELAIFASARRVSLAERSTRQQRRSCFDPLVTARESCSLPELLAVRFDPHESLLALRGNQCLARPSRLTRN